MITQNREPEYNVAAWYYTPTKTDNKLDWLPTPQKFYGAFVKIVKNTIQLVPQRSTNSSGGSFATNSKIDFKQDGKIVFSPLRVHPTKLTPLTIPGQTKIQRDGITDEFNDFARQRGNKFKTNNYVVKVISFG